MINISRLLAGVGADEARPRAARKGAPVVVWHLTGKCNLRCRHCYSAAADAEEMSPTEATLFLSRLSAIETPALLLSGGEPLAHPRFFDYLGTARAYGLRVSLSTNGTLIDRDAARRIAASGVSYAGVSFDGVGDVHDDFRGVKGAFARALAGVGFLKEENCRVGMRVTLAGRVLAGLDDIFALAEETRVSRVCFYHFTPVGRGADHQSLMPSKSEERDALRRIFAWAARLLAKRRHTEVLTVGDAASGVLLCEYLAEVDKQAARRARALLRGRQDRGIGDGIASVCWDGRLFPNQFSWDRPLGTWQNLPLLVPAARVAACLDCARSDFCCGSLRVMRGLGCLLESVPASP